MEQYAEVLEELNDWIFETYGENYNGWMFELRTNLYSDYIYFGEMLLWYNDNDGREFNEEKNDYEPLVPFIKKKLKERINKTNKLFEDEGNTDNTIVGD